MPHILKSWVYFSPIWHLNISKSQDLLWWEKKKKKKAVFKNLQGHQETNCNRQSLRISLEGANFSPGSPGLARLVPSYARGCPLSFKAVRSMKLSSVQWRGMRKATDTSQTPRGEKDFEERVGLVRCPGRGSGPVVKGVAGRQPPSNLHHLRAGKRERREQLPQSV